MLQFVPALFGAASLVFAASASADQFVTFKSDYEVQTPSSVDESAPARSNQQSQGREPGWAVANPTTPSSVDAASPSRNYPDTAATGATGATPSVREYRGGTGATFAFPSSVDESRPWLTR